MKLISLLIVFIFYTSLFSQDIIKDKPKTDDEIVLFGLREINNCLHIIPIVIIKNKKLYQPPQIEYGKYDTKSSKFVFDYLQYGYSYFKANSNSNSKAVVVSDKINTLIEVKNAACMQTVSANVNIIEDSIKSHLKNCILTNSMFLSNRKPAVKVPTSETKAKAMELFVNFYQKENGINKAEMFSEESLIFVPPSYLQLDILIGKFCIEQKGLDLKKYVSVFYQFRKSELQIINYENLYRFSESGHDWYNRPFEFIDAVDVDFDNCNELVFYYSDGGYGYKIFKYDYYDNSWKLIYYTSDGC